VDFEWVVIKHRGEAHFTLSIGRFRSLTCHAESPYL